MNIQKYLILSSFLVVNSLILNVFSQEPQQQVVTPQAPEQPPLPEVQPVAQETKGQPMTPIPSVVQPAGQANPPVVQAQSVQQGSTISPLSSPQP